MQQTVPHVTPKKTEKQKPEDDRNNVAYYKKKSNETKSVIDVDSRKKKTTRNENTVTANKIATNTILSMPLKSSKEKMSEKMSI